MTSLRNCHPTGARRAGLAGAACRAALVLLAFWGMGMGEARSQGLDSTPGERSLRILAELLPGTYDNVNQNYFDARRKLADADRHPRVATEITRVDAPAFGAYAYLWVTTTSTGAGEQRSYRIATLEAGPGAEEVTMRHYLRMSGAITQQELATLQPGQLRRTAGCDYRFRRQADHFRGLQEPGACRFEWEGEAVETRNEISVSRSSLFFIDHKFLRSTGRRITGVASGEPLWLERARFYNCYVDVPGVGGGVDLPFRRYEGIRLHDKGGTHWLDTDDSPARRIAINLRAVTWHVLNEGAEGPFNRDSLVLSVLERLADGSTREHGYVFVDPHADRVGINLKWMLANCSLTPRAEARAEL